MQILEMFGIAGSAGAVIGAAVYFGLRSYASSYLSEKGKGLATKEDIGKITAIVESIKQEHALKLAEVSEALRVQTALRFLAVERRLEIHQEAYRLWGQMLDLIHVATPEQRMEKREEHVRFWTTSCLYLDDSVRRAFASAMAAFERHRDLLDHGQHGPRYIEAINENYSAVMRLGDAIVSACNLPKIADEARVASIKEASGA